MPGLRLLARGALAAGLIAVASPGSALAERTSREDQSPVARAALGGAVSALQHDGTGLHLPPVQRNLDVVGKLELTGRFGNVLPEQIADVAVYKNHAYLNSWNTPAPCDRGGTFVVDISNPAAPREIGFLPALAQNYHGEGAHVITLDTPAFKGDVLAVNNEPCTGTTPATGGGMDLWDVTNPADPKPLVQGFGDFGPEGSLTGTNTAANESHSVFMWTTGAKAYAVQVDNLELTDVDVFDITNPRSPQPVGDYDFTARFPQSATDAALGGTVLHHDVVVKPIEGRWVMLASYWDAGYIKVDVTDPANPVYMADSDFGGADPLTGFDPPEGNAHQAEFSADNRYIVTGEEDFAPGRITQVAVDGVGTFDASAVSGGAPLGFLADGELNGPMAYGGYACAASAAVPAADTVIPPGTLLPGEEQILIVQRGPSGDTNEDYNGNGDLTDDACFPGEKAATAADAGWDAILITNRHLGTAADDSPNCGSGGYDRLVVTACTTHEALHEIFDDTPEYGLPYNDTAELVAIGTVSPHKLLNVTETFDGWGYMSLYGNTPGADGKLPLLDTYAIPEALQETYAIGFGDLSIHEQAADPTEPLSYASYYSGGVRVFSFAGGQIGELGAFIDQNGSNFWGIEQFTTPAGERLIAASDRDYGLYILRYTGPGAAQRPVCANVVAAVPFKASGTVPLSCSDANGNPLTRAVVTPPRSGTATVDQAAGAVRYTHTGDVLGTDTFTYTANDGAATAAPATATLRIGARDGGRCFNGIRGTDGVERILGSAFGDTIRAGAGRDTVLARGGADCAFGEGGRDRIEGAAGADRAAGGDSADRVLGGGGNDGVRGNGGDDDVRGGDGNDIVDGDNGEDRTDGGDGADRLSGAAGDDTISGGKGNDRMSGGAGDDRVLGGAGRDRLTGGGGADRLLVGGGRNNRVSAGGGADRVDARNGLRDRISCGGGTDRVQADRQDRVARDCERVSR